MDISINKAHYPVTVLGYGTRISIWLQGCDINCPGCISQDTWEEDPGRHMQVSQLVDWCKYVSAAGALDGVTITGGEPFYQPEPFLLFLQGLHQWREEQNLQFDILCYSGHNLQQLKKQHAEILGLLDAIIPEPYDASLPKGNHLCGSSNQQMICLTHLGQERYSSPNPSSSPSFQVAASGGKLWFIGIPEQRDMERIDTLCASKGLHFKEVSWRT